MTTILTRDKLGYAEFLHYNGQLKYNVKIVSQVDPQQVLFIESPADLETLCLALVSKSGGKIELNGTDIQYEITEDTVVLTWGNKPKLAYCVFDLVEFIKHPCPEMVRDFVIKSRS